MAASGERIHREKDTAPTLSITTTLAPSGGGGAQRGMPQGIASHPPSRTPPPPPTTNHHHTLDIQNSDEKTQQTPIIMIIKNEKVYKYCFLFVCVSDKKTHGEEGGGRREGGGGYAGDGVKENNYSLFVPSFRLSLYLGLLSSFSISFSHSLSLQGESTDYHFSQSCHIKS